MCVRLLAYLFCDFRCRELKWYVYMRLRTYLLVVTVPKDLYVLHQPFWTRNVSCRLREVGAQDQMVNGLSGSWVSLDSRIGKLVRRGLLLLPELRVDLVQDVVWVGQSGLLSFEASRETALGVADSAACSQEADHGPHRLDGVGELSAIKLLLST